MRTEKKQYVMLNCFKGYEWFESHGIRSHRCCYLDGGVESSVDYKILALTCFYLRIEIMLAYNHKGKRWL